MAAACLVCAPAHHHSNAAGNVPLRLARLAKADSSSCGLMDQAPLFSGEDCGLEPRLDYGFMAASCHVYAPAFHSRAGNVPLRLPLLAKADHSSLGLMGKALPS